MTLAMRVGLYEGVQRIVRREKDNRTSSGKGPVQRIRTSSEKDNRGNRTNSEKGYRR